MGIGKFYTPIATGGGTDISDANALVGDVALGKTFYAVSGGKKTGTLVSTAAWQPPSDWIDISTVANNEINLLVGDFGIPTIAFAVTVASSGTYSIDWGDGTVETGRTSTTTYQHSYTVGAGQSCSLGYTTFKIRIYGASGNITKWQVQRHDVTTNSQYLSILSVNFGTAALTSLFYAFFNGATCPALQKISFPATLNSCASISYAFYGCYDLQVIDMPTSMSALTTNGLYYSFGQCYKLRKITLPTTIGALTDCSYLCYNCYALEEFIFPSGVTTITYLSGAFTSCYSLKNLVLPTSLNSCLNTSTMFQYCYNLVSVTMPTSMTALSNTTAMFQNCYSLAAITLPDMLAVTTATSMFQYCYALNTITNVENLGSQTSAVSASTIFSYCEQLTSLDLYAKFSRVDCMGTGITQPNKLSSIRLRTVTTNQFITTIGFRYCNLDAAALNQLFTDLPTQTTARTINVANNPGSATCDTSIATAKNWTVTI